VFRSKSLVEVCQKKAKKKEGKKEICPKKESVCKKQKREI
jgi:hypothetical protein